MASESTVRLAPQISFSDENLFAILYYEEALFGLKKRSSPKCPVTTLAGSPHGGIRRSSRGSYPIPYLCLSTHQPWVAGHSGRVEQWNPFFRLKISVTHSVIKKKRTIERLELNFTTLPSF